MERAQFGFSNSETDVNISTHWSSTEEMAEICTSIPPSLKRHDQTQNENNEEIRSNILAFETFLLKHKDLIIYAEQSVVGSNGGTDQDKYQAYFKSKTRPLKPNPAVRKVRKVIHMFEVTFNFFSLYCGFPSDGRRKDCFEICVENLRVIFAFAKLLESITSRKMQEKSQFYLILF